MRESFSASELARPSATIPIAAVPATGRFLRRSQKSEAKHKSSNAFILMPLVSQLTERDPFCIQPFKILLN